MSPILQLLIVLVIIIVAAKASGILAVRMGQPAVLGELAAGVILGPSVINIFGLDFFNDGHFNLEETIFLMAELGVVFLMLLAGLETDLGEVNKVRKVAILAGSFGVLFPIVLGTLVVLPFGFDIKEAVFAGIILSATSVSISARTLMELGVLQGRQGISILAAAVIDDVLVILILSFFIAFAVDDGEGSGVAEVALIVGRVLFFFITAVVVGAIVLPPLMRWAANAPMSEGVFATALVVILLSAWFSEYVGEVAMITGAFLAGIFLRRTDLHHLINEKMHTISYGFFVPIFFVGVGLKADATEFAASDLLLLAAISAIAIVSKIVGSGLGARIAGEDNRSSLQIGVGMVSRGEVGLIVASVGLTQGLVSPNLFSVMVLMVLITTLVTPILLKIVFSNRDRADQERKEEQHA